MNPYEGFWQVVYEASGEEIVSYKGMHTTVSLRASGFSIYVGGHFLQITAMKDRLPPEGWPLSGEEKIRYFRSSSAIAGRCLWEKVNGGWMATHQVTLSSDPRIRGMDIHYVVHLREDNAQVEGIDLDGAKVNETWRRLSGPGSGDLAGAWESTGPTDRWLFLVSAGHYGVVREDLNRPALPGAGALSDAQTLAAYDGFGANAGAIVVGSASFDNWPMISTQAGYEARKHPTFRIRSMTRDRLVLSFAADGSDASNWSRIG